MTANTRYVCVFFLNCGLRILYTGVSGLGDRDYLRMCFKLAMGFSVDLSDTVHRNIVVWSLITIFRMVVSQDLQ